MQRSHLRERATHNAIARALWSRQLRDARTRVLRQPMLYGRSDLRCIDPGDRRICCVNKTAMRVPPAVPWGEWAERSGFGGLYKPPPTD